VTVPSWPEIVVATFEETCDPRETLPTGALIVSGPGAISVNEIVSAPADTAAVAASAANVLVMNNNLRNASRPSLVSKEA
jgi:hypothetical protein